MSQTLHGCFLASQIERRSILVGTTYWKYQAALELVVHADSLASYQLSPIPAFFVPGLQYRLKSKNFDLRKAKRS